MIHLVEVRHIGLISLLNLIPNIVTSVSLEHVFVSLQAVHGKDSQVGVLDPEPPVVSLLRALICIQSGLYIFLVSEVVVGLISE